MVCLTAHSSSGARARVLPSAEGALHTTHVHTRSCVHAQVHAHTRTWHTHPCVCSQFTHVCNAHQHTCMSTRDTCMHTLFTHSRSPTCTHTCSHTHTHTYTRAHTESSWPGVQGCGPHASEAPAASSGALAPWLKGVGGTAPPSCVGPSRSSPDARLLLGSPVDD